MTTTELVEKIKSLGTRERKKLFRELLIQEEFEEIVEDREDIIVSSARRSEPTIHTKKVSAHLDKRHSVERDKC